MSFCVLRERKLISILQQRRHRVRLPFTARPRSVGQMAQRLDDGMGPPEASARTPLENARTSTHQVVRLGRLEKALLEVPQPQAIARRRVLAKDRQEAEWARPARDIRRRNHQIK